MSKPTKTIRIEPVGWRALPGAGVVVRSGSGKVGTSVLHLGSIFLLVMMVKISMKPIAMVVIISIVISKRLAYLSPLQKHAFAQRASIVFICSLVDCDFVYLVPGGL